MKQFGSSIISSLKFFCLACILFSYCFIIAIEGFSSPVPPRRIIMGGLQSFVFIAMSVDGFIARKDGNMDWLNNQPQVEGEDFGFANFLSSVNVMIMGRKTFDTVLGFGKDAWPYGSLPIFVWTTNVDHVHIPDWVPDTVKVRSSPTATELWNELSSNKKYTHAYIDGGKTIQSFLKEGLVHRMTLTTIPILLGEGITLFGAPGTLQRNLTHVSTKSYPNGFVVSTYDVDNTNPNDKTFDT